VLALGLRRGLPAATVPSIVLCATMAVATLGWAIAALVSAASGAAPPIYMVPAAVGLGAAVIGYAVATAVVIGAGGEPI